MFNVMFFGFFNSLSFFATNGIIKKGKTPATNPMIRTGKFGSISVKAYLKYA